MGRGRERAATRKGGMPLGAAAAFLISMIPNAPRTGHPLTGTRAGRAGRPCRTPRLALPPRLGEPGGHLLGEEAAQPHVHDGAEPDELVDVHGALAVEHVPEPLAVDAHAAGELGDAYPALLPGSILATMRSAWFIVLLALLPWSFLRRGGGAMRPLVGEDVPFRRRDVGWAAPRRGAFRSRFGYGAASPARRPPRRPAGPSGRRRRTRSARPCASRPRRTTSRGSRASLPRSRCARRPRGNAASTRS